MSNEEIKALKNKIEIVKELLSNKFGKLQADERTRLEKKLTILMEIK